MELKNPVIYTRRTGEVPRYQNIESDIVGFIKFSDFYLTNDKSHYDMLKEGYVFFSTIDTFKDLSLTDAQRAVEGSTEWTSLVDNESVQQTRSYIDTSNGYHYSIQTPKAVNFQKNGKISSELIPMFPEFLNPSKLNTRLNETLNQVYDFIIYPNRFIKRKDVVYDGKIYWNYEFDRFKVLFTDYYKKSTWRICCFTKVTKDNIDISGKLKEEFIKSLLSDSGRGSIALDSDGSFRPWVFISKKDMEKSLIKYPYFSYGTVHYYDDKENPYSYSLNDLISTPDKLLFEKDCTYKTQQEFRIVSGGPNGTFSEMSNPLIHLEWLAPKSGTTREELEKLTIE